MEQTRPASPTKLKIDETIASDSNSTSAALTDSTNGTGTGDFVKNLYNLFSHFDDDGDDAITKDQLSHLIEAFDESPVYPILRDGIEAKFGRRSAVTFSDVAEWVLDTARQGEESSAEKEEATGGKEGRDNERISTPLNDDSAKETNEEERKSTVEESERNDEQNEVASGEREDIIEGNSKAIQQDTAEEENRQLQHPQNDVNNLSNDENDYSTIKLLEESREENDVLETETPSADNIHNTNNTNNTDNTENTSNTDNLVIVPPPAPAESLLPPSPSLVSLRDSSSSLTIETPTDDDSWETTKKRMEAEMEELKNANRSLQERQDVLSSKLLEAVLAKSEFATEIDALQFQMRSILDRYDARTNCLMELKMTETLLKEKIDKYKTDIKTVTKERNAALKQLKRVPKELRKREENHKMELQKYIASVEESKEQVRAIQKEYDELLEDSKRKPALDSPPPPLKAIEPTSPSSEPPTHENGHTEIISFLSLVEESLLEAKSDIQQHLDRSKDVAYEAENRLKLRLLAMEAELEAKKVMLKQQQTLVSSKDSELLELRSSSESMIMLLQRKLEEQERKTVQKEREIHSKLQGHDSLKVVEIDLMNRTIGRNEKKIDTLVRELENKSSKLIETRDLIERLEHRVAEAERDLETTTKAKSKISSELEKMYTLLEEEAAKTRDASSEAAKWKFAHELLATDLEGSKKDVAILEDELTRITSDTRKIEYELEESLSRHHEKEESIATLTQEVERLSIKVSELESSSHYKAKDSEIDSLKSEIARLLEENKSLERSNDYGISAFHRVTLQCGELGEAVCALEKRLDFQYQEAQQFEELSKSREIELKKTIERLLEEKKKDEHIINSLRANLEIPTITQEAHEAAIKKIMCELADLKDELVQAQNIVQEWKKAFEDVDNQLQNKESEDLQHRMSELSSQVSEYRKKLLNLKQQYSIERAEERKKHVESETILKNQVQLKDIEIENLNKRFESLNTKTILERLIEMETRLQETELSVLSKKMQNAIPFSDIAKLATISIDTFFIELDWNLQDLLSSVPTSEYSATTRILVDHLFSIIRLNAALRKSNYELSDAVISPNDEKLTKIRAGLALNLTKQC